METFLMSQLKTSELLPINDTITAFAQIWQKYHTRCCQIWRAGHDLPSERFIGHLPSASCLPHE